MTPLARLNGLAPGEAERELLACCGSREWARRVTLGRPYADAADLMEHADGVWRALDGAHWREAFRAHPRIGENKADAGQTDREKAWSSGEQAGMLTAAARTQQALAQGNRAYEARFGYIYIVCATGRTAEEMLQLLTARLANDPATEIVVAAEEQRKITRIRLSKLLSG